jgi:GNAT superfamily N-acetyltransferase
MHAISPDAIQSVEQLMHVWQRFVEEHPHADVLDRQGIAIRWAQSDFAFWNMVTLTEAGVGAGALDERLAQAVDYMRGKGKAGLLWLFEDLLDPAARESLPAAADRAGLTLALSGYGMAGDILPIAEPRHPELSFVRVRSEEELTAYADLNSRAYGLPLWQGRDGLNGSRLWKEEMHTYLGVKDGVPVAAAATIEADGCLFVALVATAPEEQGKGYGEAVTRKALYEGGRATGLRRATLHATMAGWPVYERIGLKKVATMRFYGLKA